MRTPDTPIPAQLKFLAWPDPVVDALGFLPHDPYSELVATPTLGPSAVLAWRRLAGTLIHRPDDFILEVAELAHALGLGAGTAHHSPICRTLRRLVAFDLARFVDESTYAVRRLIARRRHRSCASSVPSCGGCTPPCSPATTTSGWRHGPSQCARGPEMAPTVLDSATSAGAFPYGPPAEATARFCPWCYRDADRPCSIQTHWPEAAAQPLLPLRRRVAATQAMEAAGLGVGLSQCPVEWWDLRAA